MRARLNRLAWVAAVGAGAASLVYVMVALLLSVGDNDKYGKVSVPGEGVVALEQGSVVIRYEARANLGESGSIDVPADLA